MSINWQQKAAALEALAEISIKLRNPDDWYVNQRVNILEKGLVIGVFGNGATPEAAIEDHWRQLVDEIGDRYLIVREGGHPRRAVRWNGFMWADVAEPTKAVA